MDISVRNNVNENDCAALGRTRVTRLKVAHVIRAPGKPALDQQPSEPPIFDIAEPDFETARSHGRVADSAAAILLL